MTREKRAPAPNRQSIGAKRSVIGGSSYQARKGSGASRNFRGVEAEGGNKGV